MRAIPAPGGDEGLQSDPALEPSEVGGHTLLQRRLSLYGKVLVVQSILYWLIYALIWGPSVGFTRSLGHIASWDVVLLTAIYSLFWVVARGQPRSAPILLATDVGGSLAIGIDNVCLMLGDLGTISGVFANLIGFICILLLRALIVPSTVKRTLLCGVLARGPGGSCAAARPQPRARTMAAAGGSRKPRVSGPAGFARSITSPKSKMGQTSTANSSPSTP